MKHLTLLLIFPYLTKAITIQTATVVSDGSDEDTPLVEGTVTEFYVRNKVIHILVSQGAVKLQGAEF